MGGSRRSRGSKRRDSRDSSPVSHMERQSRLDVTQMMLGDARGRGSEGKSTQDTEYCAAKRILDRQLRIDKKEHPGNEVGLEYTYRLAVSKLKEEYDQPRDLQAEQKASESRSSKQLEKREQRRFQPTLESTKEEPESKYAKRRRKKEEKKFRPDLKPVDEE